MPRDPSATLYSLQIGRALAALAVVVSHAGLGAHILYPTMPETLYHVLELGNMGVDYFFVLSGFIIAHVTRGLPPTFIQVKRYAMARALRIYVPYLPISIALMVAFTLLPSLSFVDREPVSIIGSLFLLPSNDKPALVAAWTLQHEIVFYALFGICFFAAKQPRLIYLWALPIIVLSFYSMPRWMHAIFGLHNIEFLFGIAAYSLYDSRRLFNWRYALVALGAVIVAMAGAGLLAVGPSFHYHVLGGLGFAFIVLGLVYLEAQFDFSKRRCLIFLGAASYAIYLAHGPAMSAISRFYIPPNWLSAVPIFITISVMASIGYYLLIEKPLMAWARARWDRK